MKNYFVVHEELLSDIYAITEAGENCIEVRENTFKKVKENEVSSVKVFFPSLSDGNEIKKEIKYF